MFEVYETDAQMIKKVCRDHEKILSIRVAFNIYPHAGRDRNATTSPDWHRKSGQLRNRQESQGPLSEASLLEWPRQEREGWKP